MSICMVEILGWDTNFFKVKIARISPLRLSPVLLKHVMRFAQKEKVKCLYYLADCHHAPSVALAEEAGFHFVDIRLTFARQIAQNEHFGLVKGVCIRHFQTSDLPELEKIAAKSYVTSRYFFDRHFSKKICAKFYKEWIRKDCQDSQEGVFVAEDRGHAVAYITCKMINSTKGRISLVGVGDSQQRKGLGYFLVKQALKWFRDQGASSAEVVTQGRNYAAQRLYQRCGFLTQSTQLWYHKWLK